MTTEQQAIQFTSIYIVSHLSPSTDYNLCLHVIIIIVEKRSTRRRLVLSNNRKNLNSKCRHKRYIILLYYTAVYDCYARILGLSISFRP